MGAVRRQQQQQRRSILQYDGGKSSVPTRFRPRSRAAELEKDRD